MNDFKWIEDVVPNYVSTLKVGDKLRIRNFLRKGWYKGRITEITNESIIIHLYRNTYEDIYPPSLEGKIRLGTVKKKGIFLYKKIHRPNERM
jgi:hypothetical protein